MIVEAFLESGELIGSKALLKKHDLSVSSATIRNDMASLEQMGLVFQPYNSAGRLPTTRGMRVFVDYLIDHSQAIVLEGESEQMPQTVVWLENILYSILNRLTENTKEIAFAFEPLHNVVLYQGLTHFLQKNVPLLGGEAYNISAFIEDRNRFGTLLKELNPSNRVTVYIGEENRLPELCGCTIILKKTQLEGKEIILGILWAVKMDYAFNMNALRNIL